MKDERRKERVWLLGGPVWGGVRASVVCLLGGV